MDAIASFCCMVASAAFSLSNSDLSAEAVTFRAHNLSLTTAMLLLCSSSSFLDTMASSCMDL
uniref:Uncharacterized protein n=1 Tax=Arundo donax TaxID=35708 RepID=A0A0A8Y7Y1_ARUDO